MTGIHVDNISEATSANGVSIDGVKLKDNNVIIGDGGNIGSATDPDAISISSGGIVTTSARPFFRASGLASNGNVGDYLQWNNATGNDNIGSHYVFGSGETQNTCSHFITPVSGVYLFTLSSMVVATTAKDHFYIDLMSDSTFNTAGTHVARIMDIKFTADSSHVQLNGSWMGYIPAGYYVKTKYGLGPSTLPTNNHGHDYWSGTLIG